MLLEVANRINVLRAHFAQTHLLEGKRRAFANGCDDGCRDDGVYNFSCKVDAGYRFQCADRGLGRNDFVWLRYRPRLSQMLSSRPLIWQADL